MTAGSGAPGGGAPGATSGLGLGVGSGTAGTGMGQAANAATGPMGFNMGNVSSSALGLGQGSAMGMGPSGPASSSTSVATPVQNANQNAQNSNAVLGLSNIGQSISTTPTSVLGSTTATGEGMGFQVPPVNTVMSSTLGVPVTFGEGMGEGASGFVTHGNLSGQVAGTPIMSSDISNAETMNTLGDIATPLSVIAPSMLGAILGFFGETASAQTPANVANTRGALALAGPGMGAPPAAFGGNPSRLSNIMGLSNTYSPTVTANYSQPTTPEVQALVEAFAEAPQPLADPVTGVQPFSTPVQNTLIDSLLQNALAQIEANREFSPPIQNTTQQTVV
tara:strand:- start:595 stop:1599 length:1005 start_codon:yes stop_codon:yes gene_type:complete